MKHIMLVEDEVELAQLVAIILKQRALKSVCFTMVRKPTIALRSVNRV